MGRNVSARNLMFCPQYLYVLTLFFSFSCLQCSFVSLVIHCSRTFAFSVRFCLLHKEYLASILIFCQFFVALSPVHSLFSSSCCFISSHYHLVSCLFLLPFTVYRIVFTQFGSCFTLTLYSFIVVFQYCFVSLHVVFFPLLQFTWWKVLK